MFKKLATAVAAVVLVGTVGVAPPATATDYTITATAATANVVAKKKMTITGTVMPAKGAVVSSRKAIVQQYSRGKWRFVAQGQIWADGSFRVKPRFKTKGVKTLRVYKKATSESPAVATAPFQITVVKRGTPLVRPGPTVTSRIPTSPPPRDSDGDGVIDTADTCPTAVGPASNAGCPLPPPPPPPPAKGWKFLTINASSGATKITKTQYGFYGSFSGGMQDAGGRWINGGFTAQTPQFYFSSGANPGSGMFADWVLNRRCETFTARVGLDSETNSASFVRVRVYTDGTQVWTQDFRPSQHVDLSLPMANVDRIRLEGTIYTEVGGSTYTYIDFGDAQVYCLL